MTVRLPVGERPIDMVSRKISARVPRTHARAFKIAYATS
jgi:hypothetical protein